MMTWHGSIFSSFVRINSSWSPAFNVLDFLPDSSEWHEEASSCEELLSSSALLLSIENSSICNENILFCETRFASGSIWMRERILSVDSNLPLLPDPDHEDQKRSRLDEQFSLGSKTSQASCSFGSKSYVWLLHCDNRFQFKCYIWQKTAIFNN